MNNTTTKLPKPSFPKIRPEMLDRLASQAEEMAAKPVPTQEGRIKRFFRIAA